MLIACFDPVGAASEGVDTCKANGFGFVDCTRRRHNLRLRGGSPESPRSRTRVGCQGDALPQRTVNARLMSQDDSSL